LAAHLTLVQMVLMAGILVLAGMTKGVLGIGLPLVAIPLLSQVVSVPLAIMTLAVSGIASNGFQAVQGGNLGAVVRRFWPLFLSLTVTMFLAARLLVTLNERKLGFILGSVLLLFTILNQFPRLVQIRVHHERLVSPLVGVVSGILGGISSFYGPPILMYLVALKLPKAFFISAVSTAFFLGALPLMISLMIYGAMGRDELILSAVSTVPVFAGLFVGQTIQKRMPQEAFRKGLMVFLILTGVSLILRALFE
jgi:uncharacterized membrane protein YfcA